MILFFAVPEGKPTITLAHNTSASSIFIAWKPPNHDTILGEFLGYRISYRPRSNKGYEDIEEKEIYIRDPTIEVRWNIQEIFLSPLFFVYCEKKFSTLFFFLLEKRENNKWTKYGTKSIISPRGFKFHSEDREREK